jgi:hypothetical protein
MKRYIIALAVTLLGFVGLTKADTIILKNGDKIEGSILSQSPSEVVIEYNATPTIKDQKTVSRDEIVKIDSIPKDDKAFVDLGDLASPPTVLETSLYDLLIDKKIPEFLAQYPYSRHTSELREDLRILEGERSRLRQGDRKINGTWITAAQIQNDPYGFGATIKFSEMKGVVATGDPVGALQCYELIEKNYSGSDVMPDAVDLALKQISVLQGNLNSVKGNFSVLDKNRQDAIAKAPADQAKMLKESLDKEVIAAKAAMAMAATNGTKFFPVFQNNKDALDALQALVVAENARLVKLQALPMRDGIKVSEECSGLLAAGKIKEARDQLALSVKLWPANIKNTKLQQQIDDLSKAQASSGQKSSTSPTNPKP